jgi:hypothetical protein
MRRHRWTRAFVGLTALWFGAYSTDPLALHHCPMQEAMLGIGAQAHGGSVNAMGGMGGMVRDDSAPASDDKPTAPPQCTCLGMCCCAGLAVAMSDAAAVRVPTIAIRTLRPEAISTRVAPARPERVQPPSIGPPPLHEA